MRSLHTRDVLEINIMNHCCQPPPRNQKVFRKNQICERTCEDKIVRDFTCSKPEDSLLAGSEIIEPLMNKERYS